MCVLMGVSQLGFGSVVSTVALYARSFGVTQSAIGFSITVYGLARFLLAVPTGHIADRFGRHTSLALGGIITAVGTLLCAYATTFAVFVVGRFVSGAGAALVLISGQIILADITTAANRGRVMAIYSGVFAFAIGIGPFPGGVLAERFGLATPFVVFAITSLIAAAIGWWEVPETRDLRRTSETTAAPPLPPMYVQLRRLTRQIGFLLVTLINFMTAFARTGGLFSVIPVLAQDRLGLTADRIGFGLALSSLGALALVYFSGTLVDRYGRKPVIVPSTIMAAVSLVTLLFASSYTSFLVGCLLWSVAYGLSGPAPSAYAADMAGPGMNAAAMSLFRMLSDLGYVVGPVALGLITDVFGANTALATAAVLLVIVASLFAWLAPESYRARYGD